MSGILYGSNRVLRVMTVARVHLVLWGPVDSQEWWDSLDPKEPMWVFRWTSMLRLWVELQVGEFLSYINLFSTGWTWKARRERSRGSSGSESEYIFFPSRPLIPINPSITLTMYIFLNRVCLEKTVRLVPPDLLALVWVSHSYLTCWQLNFSASLISCLIQGPAGERGEQGQPGPSGFQVTLEKIRCFKHP